MRPTVQYSVLSRLSSKSKNCLQLKNATVRNEKDGTIKHFRHSDSKTVTANSGSKTVT